MSIAKVEPISKDHIVISITPGEYRAVTFKLANGGAECVILDKDATETTRLSIAPPQSGHVLEIHHIDTGVEIIYRAAP
jgi:hemolysin activation/secretion protein